MAEATRGLRCLPGGRLRDSEHLSYQSGGGDSYMRTGCRRAEGGEAGGEQQQNRAKGWWGMAARESWEGVG